MNEGVPINTKGSETVEYIHLTHAQDIPPEITEAETVRELSLDNSEGGESVPLTRSESASAQLPDATELLSKSEQNQLLADVHQRLGLRPNNDHATKAESPSSEINTEAPTETLAMKEVAPVVGVGDQTESSLRTVESKATQAFHSILNGQIQSLMKGQFTNSTDLRVFAKEVIPRVWDVHRMLGYRGPPTDGLFPEHGVESERLKTELLAGLQADPTSGISVSVMNDAKRMLSHGEYDSFAKYANETARYMKVFNILVNRAGQVVESVADALFSANWPPPKALINEARFLLGNTGFEQLKSNAQSIERDIDTHGLLIASNIKHLNEYIEETTRRSSGLLSPKIPEHVSGDLMFHANGYFDNDGIFHPLGRNNAKINAVTITFVKPPGQLNFAPKSISLENSRLTGTIGNVAEATLARTRIFSNLQASA